MRIHILSVIVVSLSLLSGVAAQDAVRQRPAERITAQYLGEPVAPDSPIVQQEVALAKTLNPDTKDEVWREVAKDLATTLSDEMTGRGSPGFESVALALKQLSDAEVQQLDVLLSHPAYRKFQAAMASAAAQEALAKGIYRSGLSAHEAIEGVFRRHNLKY